MGFFVISAWISDCRLYTERPSGDGFRTRAERDGQDRDEAEGDGGEQRAGGPLLARGLGPVRLGAKVCLQVEEQAAGGTVQRRVWHSPCRHA